MDRNNKPDIIMVLAGEDTYERHRSKKAAELYHLYHGEVPLLISGSHSGLLGRTIPANIQKECLQMKAFLENINIPVERIEENSMDTLGNFFYSHSLIKPKEIRIALITDEFHMGRANWCSHIVFDNQKEIIEYPSLLGTTKNNQRIERFMIKIIGADLWMHGVKHGDYDSLAKYMRTYHPFHSIGSPKLSLYGFFARIFSNRNLAQALLPTQKQAYQHEKY